MNESTGPGNQPRRGHETRDANTRNVIIFVVAVCCLVIAGLLVSKAVLHYFVGQQELGPPASPFENVRMLPPEPRLQVSAPKDLKKYKAAQGEILNSYGWVDQKAGIVRIPIERAMDILSQTGLGKPAPAHPNSDGTTQARKPFSELPSQSKPKA